VATILAGHGKLPLPAVSNGFKAMLLPGGSLAMPVG
jgi:hypothetical protein